MDEVHRVGDQVHAGGGAPAAPHRTDHSASRQEHHGDRVALATGALASSTLVDRARW